MKRPSNALYTLCCSIVAGIGLGGMVLLLGACADNQIGRLCNNPSSPVTNGVTFVNPAPDCPSRLCMITPPSNSPLAQPDHKTGTTSGTGELRICTADCNTDDDCASQFANSTRCSKFVCAVPSVVPGEENFCCKKLCMCNADLTPGLNVDDTRGNMLPRDSFNVPIPFACTRADSCTLK